MFQNKHNLKASLIYCYYYLLLLSEVADLRSPGSPKPLVPDLLSHRVARSVPEINTASTIMAKPPLSGRGWVKQLYSVVSNTERHHSLENNGKTASVHSESTFSAVLFSATRRRCGVVQTAGGVGFSGGLHQLQEVLGCSNHSIWQTKAPPTTKGSWGQLDQGHTGIKPITHNPLISLIYHYRCKCQTCAHRWTVTDWLFLYKIFSWFWNKHFHRLRGRKGWKIIPAIAIVAFNIIEDVRS